VVTKIVDAPADASDNAAVQHTRDAWVYQGLIRFSGQSDGGRSYRGASPQSASMVARSAPFTSWSALMSER
jgi:hypothetical protein